MEADSIIQAVIVGELYGQQTLNVLHYFQEDGDADFRDPLSALLDDWDAADGLLKKVCLATSEEFFIRTIMAQVVYPSRLVAVRRTTHDHNQGEILNPALPPNVAAVITKKTDFAGRDQVGGFHLAGCPQEGQEEAEWTDGQRELLVAVGNKIIESINLGGFGNPAKPILWDPGTPTVRSEVTDFDLQRTIRIMRRRTKGVGR